VFVSAFQPIRCSATVNRTHDTWLATYASLPLVGELETVVTKSDPSVDSLMSTLVAIYHKNKHYNSE